MKNNEPKFYCDSNGAVFAVRAEYYTIALYEKGYFLYMREKAERAVPLIQKSTEVNKEFYITQLTFFLECVIKEPPAYKVKSKNLGSFWEIVLTDGDLSVPDLEIHNFIQKHLNQIKAI